MENCEQVENNDALDMHSKEIKILHKLTKHTRSIPFSALEFDTERVEFLYTEYRYPTQNWFDMAMGEPTLKWTLGGAISALLPKGEQGRVFVIDTISPKLMPDITMYCSEHGNWHVGIGPKKIVDPDELSMYNKGQYTYFQTTKFFVALRKLSVGDIDGRKVILLYVHEKDLPGPADRACQD